MRQSPSITRAARLRSRRAGVTLVEMLVSLACVILLMMAYTTLFGETGSKIGEARSMIELTNRMRSATNLLREDLAGATCELLPWTRPESGSGYFEIIEGRLSDTNNGLTDDAATADYNEALFPLGDTDDVLMFTVRSRGAPFVGRVLVGGIPPNETLGGTPSREESVESDTAEVVWYVRPTLKTDGSPVDPQTYTLYRRVFLVLPSYNGNTWRVPVANFSYDNYDISVHRDGSDAVGNNLGDLTKRENRFAHTLIANFPHTIDPAQLFPFGTQSGTDSVNEIHDRYGEDVVLTNVLAFDVRVWDPTAPVQVVAAGNATSVTPGDYGYTTGGTTAAVGAYVDLNWGNVAYDSSTALTPFRTQGSPFSRLNANAVTGNYATYDTWSFHYEHDGLDQDGDMLIDEGTNGIDDPPFQNGVDDAAERETSPPYPAPLRGIQIKLRCYEPDARQVIEKTIKESFLPE